MLKSTSPLLSTQILRLTFITSVLLLFAPVFPELFSSAYAQGNVQQRLVDAWNSLFRSPPPRPRRGAGKGDGFCLVAPLNVAPDTGFITTSPIFSDRPTFTWRSIPAAPDAPGAPVQIELRKDGDSTVLWSRPITAATQINLPGSTSASGTPTPSIYQITSEIPLEPGQRYEWRIARRAINTAWLPLQLVTMQERDRITQELQTLNQQLARQGVTGEAAIVRRADYFASQELWSEFWREVLSVQNPSVELRTAIDRAFGLLCD
jgi:hypothetical protein